MPRLRMKYFVVTSHRLFVEDGQAVSPRRDPPPIHVQSRVTPVTPKVSVVRARQGSPRNFARSCYRNEISPCIVRSRR